MNPLEEYKSKLISIPDAVTMVKPGQTISMAMAAGEPVGLLTELANHHQRLDNIDLWTCLPMRPYEVLVNPDMADTFSYENWFYSGYDRKAHANGNISYIPNNLHRAVVDKLRATKGHVDIFWGTATPPDARGFVSLSLGLVIEKELIEAADLVILEINENLPHTYGDTHVHISEVDYFVENHVPLMALPPAGSSELEEKIGGYIADLIPDEATLQLGIGGIPNAITKLLMGHKDLGVHTELLVDGMIDLFEAGVITNRKKTLWRDKMVAAFVMGDQKLYDFLDHNMGVTIQRGNVTNDPYVIGKNRRMISVNSALQIDILGQVCSQSIGSRHFSGTGGQLDTHRGAQLSEEGRGIIALRSTAKKGTISTIVPTLSPGAEVTIPSQDVDTIVTEYGVAELRGKALKDRMEALIAIAHPEFRDWIREEASKLGMVY